MCRHPPCVPHDDSYGEAQQEISTVSKLRDLAATKLDNLKTQVLSRPTGKHLLRLVSRLCLIERKVPPWLKMGLIHLVSRVMCYWLPNLLLVAMQRFGVGRQWR